MMTRYSEQLRRRLAPVSPGAMIAALLLVPAAASAQTVPLETIVVNAKADSPAAAIAPGSTPLDAAQPTSVISQDFIAKNLAPSGNYDEAIKFSPSVFDTAPNGPGLAESQNISIRGFVDGQFNVTFDGIPWGDSNDFTHHTTSYFMAHDLGQIDVDRGPGAAATIGNATFGGTVSTLSKAPDEHFGVHPYVSYGSFDTFNAGAEVDSGTFGSGTRVLVDAQLLSSDGYLTNMGQKRQNIYAKVVQPLGGAFTLTAVAMYNHVHQNISLGATAAEIAQFGPNYGLSKDPSKQNYFGYNADFIHTDFEYVDLAGDLGAGWALDAKVYSYAYFHKGLNGEDPNGEFPNVTSIAVGDVPGQLLTNNYRSVGAIARLTKTLPFGDLQTGIWYDHQINRRSLYEVDMTAHEAPNLDDADTGAVDGSDRDLNQTLQTVQPYVQLNIKPVAGLTLTPGLRYSWFDRNVDAVVNVKTALPQVYDNTFHAWLPSFEARYAVRPDLSIYGQVAKGFLAPNENFFNHADPNSTTLQPQTTWNYQVGTAYRSGRMALSLDGYIIDFSNLINGVSVGGQTQYTNLGGATYRGIEAEGTVTLGGGFSAYVNGSVNSAKDQATGQWLPNAPKATAAGGLIYSKDGIYVSLLGKWIGPRFGDTGETQYLPAFATADVSFGFDLGRFMPQMAGANLKINVNNITDTTKIINLAGYTVGGGTPLYWTQPGRSVFASLEFKL